MQKKVYQAINQQVEELMEQNIIVADGVKFLKTNEETLFEHSRLTGFIFTLMEEMTEKTYRFHYDLENQETYLEV